MRVLITGAGGFVAGSVLLQFPKRDEMFAISRKKCPTILQDRVQWFTVDGADEKDYIRVVEDVKPNCIIHTLAMADIDACEQDPNRAKFVNVDITQALLEASERMGSRFIFCSTDTVFDGRRGMYTELDSPSPLNVYGWTKVDAERAVMKSRVPWVIARLSLVMGFPMLGIGNSFFVRMERCAQSGQPIPMPADEYRTPIDVITVGQCLIELAKYSDFTGIIHLAGNERISRYAMGIMIAREMGWDESLVCSSVIQKGIRAPRPKDVSLSNEKAKRLLTTPFLNVVEGIRRIQKYKEYDYGAL